MVRHEAQLLAVARTRELTAAEGQARLSDPSGYVVAEWREIGLGVREVGETLKSVMHGEDEQARVAAAKVALGAMVPQVSRSQQVVVHAKADRFFDAETFAKTPAPKID